MFAFIIEFLVSLVVCAVAVYFFFLSAPVEEDFTSSTSSSPQGTTEEQQKAQDDSVFLSLGSGGAVAAVVRLIAVHVFGYTGHFEGAEDDTATNAIADILRMRRARPGAAGRLVAAAGSSGSDGDFKGGTHQQSQRPEVSSLKVEGAYWINVISRWSALLLLGGGSPQQEVWLDRVRYSAEKAVHAMNMAMERARLASLAGRKQAAVGLVSVTSHKPLLRLIQLELGPGLSAAALLASYRSNSGSFTAAVATGAGGGGVAAVSNKSMDGGGSGHNSNSGGVAHIEPLSLGSTLRMESSLSQTVGSAARSRSLTQDDLVDSLSVTYGAGSFTHGPSTTSGGGGAAGGPVTGVAIPHVSRGITSVEVPMFNLHVQQYQQQNGPLSSPHKQLNRGAASGGRAAEPLGAVIGSSFLIDSSPVLQRGSLSGMSSASSPSSLSIKSEGEEQQRRVGGSGPVPARSLSTLRCFKIPIVYEDGRFSLRVDTCVPLLWFLPAQLCIPPDALSIECTAHVRRVHFDGCIYAAFLGGTVELSFPEAPLFSTIFEVAAPGDVSTGGGASMGRPKNFTTTSTMRNSSTAAGASAAAMMTAAQFSGGAGAVPSVNRGIGEKNEKVQELVMLGVRKAVQSITYPCVLEGTVRSHRGGASAGDQRSDGFLSWARKTEASLPLYC